jgi:hypothetical protein
VTIASKTALCDEALLDNREIAGIPSTVYLRKGGAFARRKKEERRGEED